VGGLAEEHDYILPRTHAEAALVVRCMVNPSLPGVQTKLEVVDLALGQVRPPATMLSSGA
jgi:hypothetical protein